MTATGSISGVVHDFDFFLIVATPPSKVPVGSKTLPPHGVSSLLLFHSKYNQGGTKSLLVVDCIESLTALSEVNWVTIMWDLDIKAYSGMKHGLATEEESRDQTYRSGALPITILE